MDLNQALEYVNTCNDPEDLRRVNRYVLTRLRQIQEMNALSVKSSLKQGSKVKFNAGIPQGRGRKRRSAVLSGVVVAVKQKYIHVKTENTILAGSFADKLLRVPMGDVTVIGAA